MVRSSSRPRVCNDIIPELEANSILAQLGLRTYSGLTGNGVEPRPRRNHGVVPRLGSGRNRLREHLDLRAHGAEAARLRGVRPAHVRHAESARDGDRALGSLAHGVQDRPAQGSERLQRHGCQQQADRTLNAGTQTLSWSGVNTAAELIPKIAACVAKLPEANAMLPGAKLGWAMGSFAVSYLSGSFDTTGRSLLWNVNQTTLATLNVRLNQLANYMLKETTQLNTGATTGTEVFTTATGTRVPSSTGVRSRSRLRTRPRRTSASCA